MVIDDIVGEVERTADQIAELHANNRCDGCNSQAYVVMVHPTGLRLDFCSHDYNKHEAALISSGWAIGRDERDKLIKRSNDVHA